MGVGEGGMWENRVLGGGGGRGKVMDVGEQGVGGGG